MQSCLSYHLKDSGLTLLSMLLALALSALLLTISVPSLSAFSSSGQRALRQEAIQIKDLLENLILQTSLTQNEGKFIYSSTNYRSELLEPTGWRQIERRALQSSFNLEVGFQSEKEINFYPSGVNFPATIHLKSPHAQCTIRISLHGRVSLQC